MTSYLGSSLKHFNAEEIHRKRDPTGTYTQNYKISANYVLSIIFLNRNTLPLFLLSCPQFDAPMWDDISDAAKDLVQRMLTVDHTQRINIQEVLNHRWIRVSRVKILCPLNIVL